MAAKCGQLAAIAALAFGVPLTKSYLNAFSVREILAVWHLRSFGVLLRLQPPPLRMDFYFRDLD